MCIYTILYYQNSARLSRFIRGHPRLRSSLRTAFKQGYAIAVAEESDFVEARFVQSQLKEHKKLSDKSLKSASHSETTTINNNH